MIRLLRRLSRKVPTPPPFQVAWQDAQSKPEHDDLLRRKQEVEARVYRLQRLSDLRTRTGEEQR